MNVKYEFYRAEDLSDNLKALASDVLNVGSETSLTLEVRRSHVLQDSLDEMDLATDSDLHKPLRIHFIGEQAADEGGPTREFASLLVRQLQTSSLMEGNCMSVYCIEKSNILRIIQWTIGIVLR